MEIGILTGGHSDYGSELFVQSRFKVRGPFKGLSVNPARPALRSAKLLELTHLSEALSVSHSVENSKTIMG